MGCIVKGINRICDTDDAVALLQDLSSLPHPYTSHIHATIGDAGLSIHGNLHDRNQY